MAIALLAWKIESRLGPDVLTVTPKGNSSVVEVRGFAEFPIYSAGSSFRRLKLNAVDHAINHFKRATIELGFLYGTCELPRNAEGGCGLPLSIQNWPACAERIHGLGYHRDPGESMTVRGVPAALYEGQGRLALATGTTTIVIYGSGRRFLLAAARSLRGVNSSVGPSDNLPKPARGALDGTLEY